MYRRLPVALVAACLTVGMVAAPSAVAAEGSKAKAAKVSTTSKARQAGTSTPSPRDIARRLNTTRRQVATARRRLSTLGKELGALNTRLKSAEGGVGTILAAAPQLVSGLQTLAGVVQNQIGPGLLQLKNVLEKQVQPALVRVRDEVVPGLQRLGSAYQSVEYGRAGIFAGGPANPASTIPGQFTTSADIPDDGNTITTNESAFVVAQATDTMTIDLRAAIRSAESDGDSTSETAGQAGGFVFVRDGTGARVACAGAPNPPGIFGTTAGDSIVTPGGTVTNLPLKNIPGGVPRTDTAAPTSSSTSLLPAACSFAATIGSVYEVHYSVNFVDIPTSTSPGPTE